MNLYIKKPFGSGPNSKTAQWKKLALRLIAVGLAVIVLNVAAAQVRDVVYSATSPILFALHDSSIFLAGLFKPILAGRGLLQENQNLKEENQRLIIRVAELEKIISQNQLVQEVIENTKPDNFTMALAEIIGLNGQEDVVVLNKGANDGIAEGMPVISNNKVLVGRVLKIYANYSQVVLVSNEESITNAMVNQSQEGDSTDSKPIFGAVKGAGNLGIYFDLIPLEAQLRAGDTVTTSGREGIFPKGLLIGKVAGIQKDDQKPFQTASLQPLFDVAGAETVFIITNYPGIKTTGAVQ